MGILLTGVREEKYLCAVQKYFSPQTECANDFASMGKKHCPSNDFITDAL